MKHAIETLTLPARGLEFAADLAGPQDGPLVLLLHGFPQSRYTWRHELPALAARGLRGCAPDQRGYSPGARPEGVDAYRTEELVADVLALAAALGHERFHLVGHDWGGQLAWCTAALHPENVITLAVISRPHPAAFVRAIREDPQQSKRSSHHRSFQRPEATDEVFGDDGDSLRRLLTQAGVPPRDAEGYLATLCDRAAVDAAINWYRATGLAGVELAELPSTTMPTLYVWGDADATVGRQAAEATRDFVAADYRFVELPGVGHFVTDQAPEAFPPLLLEHVQS